MIAINKRKVTVTHFPDGTQYVVFPNDVFATKSKEDNGKYFISWFYDSDEELFTLASAVDFIKRNTNNNVSIVLEMPYLPNARMDRIKNPNENFSLKVFSNFINSFKFDKVIVHNVHSNVSEALIDNIVSEKDEEFILQAIAKYHPDVLFFPDEGACKRYSDLAAIKSCNLPILFGIKKRDWKTGKILGLDVVGNTEAIVGKRALIIDDICSAGGTFKFSAMKLKEMGVEDVALYVTHCEDNIQNGDLLKTDLISTIYTTDSILHIENEKIVKINNFRKTVY